VIEKLYEFLISTVGFIKHQTDSFFWATVDNFGIVAQKNSPKRVHKSQNPFFSGKYQSILRMQALTIAITIDWGRKIIERAQFGISWAPNVTCTADSKLNWTLTEA